MKRLGVLTPIPPYNLQLTLDLLTRYIHPVLDVTMDGAYWRALHTEGGLALLRVSQEGTEVYVDLAASTGEIDETALLQRMRHIIGIEIDLAPFYRVAKDDSDLWRVIEPLVGLRWLRSDTVFEALMFTTIEQQIAWTAAQRAQFWLLGWGGHTITYHGIDFYAFPTPAQIAAASVDDLVPLKITFKRMRVMIEIAQQIVDRTLDLESLKSADTATMYKTITAIKGIGHWTATWTIQRALGPHNYVGHNDVALQAAVNHYFYGGEGRIPEEKVIETYARYGEFAGMAANHTLMRWVMDRYEARP